MVYVKAAQPMAREIVLSGLRCNKFTSRLFKFLVFFIGSSNIVIKTTIIIPVVSVVGLPPKNL